MKKCLIVLLSALIFTGALADDQHIRLDSKPFHSGGSEWLMARICDVPEAGETVSTAAFRPGQGWMEAIVPGTVLNTLVHNGVFPEPYYGLNNKIESGLIPDISVVGRDFYTAWFRTEFDVPESFKGRQVWLQLDGINYRAEVWVNGNLLATIGGMFKQEVIDVTSFVKPGSKAVLAIKTIPVDMPGAKMLKNWGATGEFHNGGDGNIGYNTTMLMSVGWDFTFMDGIRDRNTGIWKGVSLYSTGKAALRWPFIKSELSHPSYDEARETVEVTVVNPSTDMRGIDFIVRGEIEDTGISFEKKAHALRGAEAVVRFTPEEFPQLVMKEPRLWWPVNKGPQNLYRLNLSVEVGGEVCDRVSTTFGVREIVSDQNTPDNSRLFRVNGRRMFIRGTNWIPEAMLRMSDERTEAELRYTKQCGVNLLRLWGGGIEESPRFYELCDSLGIMVWQEFWMTGDTRHPQDRPMYLANVESSVKRLRNHPSLAYYVASNESSEVTGMRDLLYRLDGTRGYQVQSECDGIHDGSPYKQVNPMRHYENTASDRGSRVDGFNPEYGSPCLPTVECLREMMDEKDLWPVNKAVWDYMDGDGFSLMTSLYKDMTDQYGESSGIDEFARKAQFVGAMNYKSIWEVWNYNKFDYGDRWASGVLFWYHNSAIRHVGSMMWDWSLEPMASLYAAANALEPLHVQFDYLKNTVSVVNDYPEAYSGLKVRAAVYDFSSRKVWEKSVPASVDADGAACDVMTIDFPASITKVHFIKLWLTDASGAVLSNNFYWRSTDAYEGKNTLTGPCTSGFQDISSMKQTSLKTVAKMRVEGGRHYLDLTVTNRGPRIAFFTQIQLLDSSSSPVRPSFYTDNFFSLLPGEKKTVTIETASAHVPADGLTLKVRAWNAPESALHFMK